MKLSHSPNRQDTADRRSFLKNFGGATAALAIAGLASPRALEAATGPNLRAVDTPKEIFTAALIAEDLAVTFYYNGLIGAVIQDPNLAGPGGSATSISPSGQLDNVGYLRAALTEESAHADLFRLLLGIKSPTADPFQTFFFDPAAFETLDTFIATLSALENAFIGACMAAVQQFGLMAGNGGTPTIDGVTYHPSDFAYFAKISASILGIESEHRALIRSISPALIPANQLNYEQTDGIATVFNGPNSAVAALTPFLSQSGPSVGYSLQTALAHVGGLGLRTFDNVPQE